jgi:hypothetical protein
MADRSAPFWGPKTCAACSKVVVTSQRTASEAWPSPPAHSIASIAPAPPSVVALPPTATQISSAPASRAATLRYQRSKRAPRAAPTPAQSLCHLHNRFPPTVYEGEARRHRTAQRITNDRLAELPTPCRQEHVHRAFASVGNGTEVGRPPDSLGAGAEGPCHRSRRERPLEGVRCDQQPGTCLAVTYPCAGQIPIHVRPPRSTVPRASGAGVNPAAEEVTNGTVLHPQEQSRPSTPSSGGAYRRPQ